MKINISQNILKDYEFIFYYLGSKSSSGSSICTQWTAGYYSNSGDSSCTFCSSGYISQS